MKGPKNKDYGMGQCGKCEKYAIVNFNGEMLCHSHLEQACKSFGDAFARAVLKR